MLRDEMECPVDGLERNHPMHVPQARAPRPRAGAELGWYAIHPLGVCGVRKFDSRNGGEDVRRRHRTNVTQTAIITDTGTEPKYCTAAQRRGTVNDVRDARFYAGDRGARRFCGQLLLRTNRSHSRFCSSLTLKRWVLDCGGTPSGNMLGRPPAKRG
jgi:hypothetical protein